MAKTLGQLEAEVLYRLGDTTEYIWTSAEIARYLNEGYEAIARSGMLWDTTYLEDQSYAGSHTTNWEQDYMPSGFQLLNQFHYNHLWEAQYAFGNQINLGPSNHTTLWEYDDNYVATPYFLAVHKLPDSLIQIERVVWDKKRIDPLKSSELMFCDNQFETQTGQVQGYVQDKDGLRSFRKWRVPSQAADEYTVSGQGTSANYTNSWEPTIDTTFTYTERFAFNVWWEAPYADSTLRTIAPSVRTASWEDANKTQFGLLRDPSDISAETVIGSWGVARRIPGEHPCLGFKSWGIPRRVYKPARNTKIEFTRKGAFLNDATDVFEIPDIYVKYIRHFAMYRALDHNGKGQDIKLAQFWKSRWAAGLARVKRRMESTMKSKTHILGAARPERNRPPLARWPWAYGRVVR